MFRLKGWGGSPFYDAILARDSVKAKYPGPAPKEGELPSASLVIWKFRKHDLPTLRQWKALLENYEQVREQVFGDAYDPRGLDCITKYDVALDRKLDRTLSTLMKVQAIRKGRLGSQ